MEKRVGDWMQTYSGHPFWPLDPRPEDVHPIDIAHALSMKCRYGGHTLCFYSVAEHSVLLHDYVEPEHRLWALLHDAAEAYSADVVRPLKRHLPGWKEIEARIMRAVCDRFGLAHQEPAVVKEVDLRITSDEQAALMEISVIPWSGLLDPLGVEIVGHTPHRARELFLDRLGRHV